MCTLSGDISDGLLAPVYALSSAEEVNYNLLKIWARKSGGDYVNVRGMSPKLVVDKLGRNTYGFISATFDKSVVSEVFPSIPTTINGTTFKISGKITQKNEEQKDLEFKTYIQLNYGYGTQVLHQARFTLTIEDIESGLVPRFWASRNIEQLQLFPEIKENEQKILELGRRYNIVTPNTSLIVLETLDQYLKYEIEPPQSLPKIHAEWTAIMQEKEWQNNEKTEEKINDVLSLWKRRVAWWNDDGSNLESKESYIIHSAQFGMGIDHMEKKTCNPLG